MRQILRSLGLPQNDTMRGTGFLLGRHVMKRTINVLLLLSGFIACAPALAQKPDAKHKETDAQAAQAPLKPYYGPLRRAVVTAMEVKVQGVATTAPTPSGTTTVVTIDIAQPTEFGTGLADMLVTALVASKRFVVLERLNLEEVHKERAQGQAPEFDQTTAVKTGRLLGAQVIIRGAVTELAVKKSGAAVGGLLGDTIGFSKSSAESRVAIDLKMIDVGTGQVLDSVRAEGKAVSKGQSFTITKEKIKLGDSAFDNSPLGVAVRAAIDDGVRKICGRMEKLPWQAKLASVGQGDKGPVLYLNMGADSGLQPGDILEITRPGAEIIDPDTKLVLGREVGKKVGRCRVDQVQPKLTLADPIDGTGFQPEDVVTFLERPGAPKEAGSSNPP